MQATSQQVVPACANLARQDVQGHILYKVLSQMVFMDRTFKIANTETSMIVAAATCFGEPLHFSSRPRVVPFDSLAMRFCRGLVSEN